MSIKSGIIRAIGRLARNRDGNVLIMSALLLPILIGMAALVTEYGSALVERADNQRIADLSAYAGALAYNSTKSTDRMTAAAVSVATLNGIPAADVQASLVASPKTSGMNAVSVSIRTQKNLLLARVLHAAGLSRSGGYSFGRFWGTALTWLVLLLMALAGGWLALV